MEVKYLTFFFMFEQGAPLSLHVSQRMSQFPVRWL